MAIRTEQIGETQIRHYSDEGFKIRQIETGILYDDAVDVVPCRYTYEESNEPIEDYELTSDEALEIIIGQEGLK